MAKKSLSAVPTSVISFFREARDELKKVTWPSREVTIRYTVIVIIASIGIGLLTGGIDYVFTKALQSLIS